MKNFILLMAIGIMLSNSLFSQNKLTSEEKRDGWELLFNGINFDGWTTIDNNPVPDGWKVIDGTITAVKDGNGGSIISLGEFSNFDLSLDYKIEPGVNSGVKYFSRNMKMVECWEWNIRS